MPRSDPGELCMVTYGKSESLALNRNHSFKSSTGITPYAEPWSQKREQGTGWCSMVVVDVEHEEFDTYRALLGCGNIYSGYTSSCSVVLEVVLWGWCRVMRSHLVLRYKRADWRRSDTLILAENVGTDYAHGGPSRHIKEDLMTIECDVYYIRGVSSSKHITCYRVVVVDVVEEAEV